MEWFQTWPLRVDDLVLAVTEQLMFFLLRHTHRSYDHSLDELSMAVNSQTVKNSRDDLIKHLLRNREEEYTDIKTYR